MTDQSTKGIGLMAWQTDKEDSFTLMEICTRACGLTIRLKVSACTAILTVQSMKVSGLMISNMAQEKRHGQMEILMRVVTWKEKDTVKVFKSGSMAPNTKANTG